jgi:type I restriction enzyme S subunit
MSKWAMTPMGSLLSKSENWITPEPLKEYSEVTVRLWGKGVVLRGKVAGSEIAGGRRLQVRATQFILSRIDARNGATGLIPDSLDGAVVTNDFPVYNLNNERVFPQFLSWMSKTAGFVELCKRASEETTNRVRLKEDRFLATEIPLPPLSEQRRIVVRIESLAGRIGEASGLRQQATEEAEALVHANRNQIFREVGSRYSPTRLDSVAACRLGKMLDPRFKTGIGATPYLRNANVQWDRLDLREVYQMDFTEDERTEFALESGDILVCEGGDIGKTAIWNNEIPGCCYQKALHRVRCDQVLAMPRFILHHLFWAAHEGHWHELKTQTTIPHLTGVKLKAYSVYIPPISDQGHIVAYLDGLQAKVDGLKKLQAETADELAALLPSILDKAFKGEL